MRLFLASVVVVWVAAEAQFHHDDTAILGSVRPGDEELVRPQGSRAGMNLHMMPEKGLKGQGAVCLDGSDAGFYFAPASNPVHANHWQLDFQGGGWCYDEIDCWGRSNTSLGSSHHWGDRSSGGGLSSDNCTVNPDFCNANRVLMPYCDGNSFAGNRDEPLVVKGLDGKDKALYFRGKRIMDAVLETLLGMGLDKAEQVLLTGASAGGLAAFLHADYVGSLLRQAGAPLRKFRAAPIGGFFLPHTAVEGQPVYPEQMKYLYEMSNATASVHKRCLTARAAEDSWKCNFAPFAYAVMETPTFILNSALDSWQTSCIFMARLAPHFPKQNVTDNGECNAVPAWRECHRNLELCSSNQMAALNEYMEDFIRSVTSTETWRKAGNGAFLHSCHTHAEAIESEDWLRIAVNGVTMQQAFSRWWKSEEAPASEHSFEPCLYHTRSKPHGCNPTCQQVETDRALLI